MSKNLSSIKVDVSPDIFANLDDGKDSSNADIVFKDSYKKYLLKQGLENIASDLLTDEGFIDIFLEKVKSKCEELGSDKFALRIVKLMKEEIESELKPHLSQLSNKRHVVTLDKFTSK